MEPHAGKVDDFLADQLAGPQCGGVGFLTIAAEGLAEGEDAGVVGRGPAAQRMDDVAQRADGGTHGLHAFGADDEADGTTFEVGALVVAQILDEVDGILDDAGDATVVGRRADDDTIGLTQALDQVGGPFGALAAARIVEFEWQRGVSDQAGLAAHAACMLEGDGQGAFGDRIGADRTAQADDQGTFGHGMRSPEDNRQYPDSSPCARLFRVAREGRDWGKPSIVCRWGAGEGRGLGCRAASVLVPGVLIPGEGQVDDVAIGGARMQDAAAVAGAVGRVLTFEGDAGMGTQGLSVTSGRAGQIAAGVEVQGGLVGGQPQADTAVGGTQFGRGGRLAVVVEQEAVVVAAHALLVRIMQVVAAQRLALTEVEAGVVDRSRWLVGDAVGRHRLIMAGMQLQPLVECVAAGAAVEVEVGVTGEVAGRIYVCFLKFIIFPPL